jgi:hypothetical protein
MTMLAAVRHQLLAAARRLARRRPRGRLGAMARMGISLALLGAVSAGAVGCGGAPSDAIAQVNGTPITVAALEHWMRIAVAGTSTPSASGAAIPKPPDYTACIAALAADAAKPAKGAKAPSHAQLKAQCASEYESLKTDALGYLISADWLIGEASAQDVAVTDRQVHARLISIVRQEFPAKGSFARFLHSSPYTVSDLLLRIKLEMLSERIERKVLGRAGKATQKRSFAAFKTAFRKRWTARTDCRPGYVVLNCRQYRAPGSR